MDGPLTGRRLAGYELRDVLGRGATATVYRARQTRLGRDVAVKVLDPAFGDTPEYVERFEREGRAAANLDHPSIVTIYEAGEADGLLFIAMKLIEGITLAQRLENEAELDPDQVAALLRPVADALDHAHESGVVHRDVKPSNIFLDARGRVFLGDFGVAGLVQGVARETVGAVGTADYMAPEQVEGAQAGAAADIYSLGCVVYECVAGDPPFTRPTVLATLRAQVDEEITPTGDSRVDAVLARALAKNAESRPPLASMVIEELGGRPSPIGSGSALSGAAASGATAPRFGGRRKVIGAVCGVVVLGLFAVGIAVNRDDAPAESADTLADTAVDTPIATGPPATESPTATEPSAVEPSAVEPTPAPVPTDPPSAMQVSLEIGLDAAVTDFDTLNPHIEPFNTRPLVGNVLPVLYDLDADLVLVPSLAARLPVIVSDDPLVVDYELRPDALWDDGSAITATDAVATYDYMLSLGDQLVGRQPYASIAEVEALTDTTVRVEYASSHYSFGLFLSANHPVLPAAALRDHAALGGAPADFLADEIGFSAGPFSLSRADLGDGPGAGVELRFVRNERWWGEPARLERVTLRHYRGLADATDALDNGDVDALYLRRPTIGTGNEFDSMTEMVARPDPVGPSAFVVFSNADTLGADPVVRRAVIAAIDRTALADAVFAPAIGTRVTPLDSLAWVPEHADARAPFDGVGGRPDDARRILAEGGWTLVPGDPVDRWVRNGEELQLSLLLDRAPPIGQLGATMPIQLFNDLQAAGIDLEAFAEDQDRYAERASTGDFDLRIVFTPTQVDPTANLVFFGGSERAFAYDGLAADLIREAESTVDADHRQELVDQAEADLIDSAFALPLFRTTALTVGPDDLELPMVNGRFAGPLIDLAAWGFAS